MKLLTRDNLKIKQYIRIITDNLQKIKIIKKIIVGPDNKVNEFHCLHKIVCFGSQTAHICLRLHTFKYSCTCTANAYT